MTQLWRDRYEPLEVVGQGGQGSVVRALDHLHDRYVALKIRPLGASADRQALLAEARVLLGLEPHPLVALARDDFFLDDRYVLVMDWVAGVPLADRLAEAAGGLRFEDVLAWLAQVAEALDHLHAHRPPVVHGDVKPANIVVTPEGKAVLVDFGIARRDAAPDVLAHGTRNYMAPELATGAPPTPASDVFALAATAFTLLTGAPPAPGQRPDWTRVAGARAAEVEAALRRGLAVDPSRRPSSAGSLVAALQGSAPPPNNLPAALTSFVGRRRDITDVAARLGEVRLLTLSGTGGLGKTRLALEVASRVLPEYPDGVFLIELAPLDDPDLVSQEMLAALGIAEAGGQEAAPNDLHGPRSAVSPVARLIGHLVTRQALLVLDNCEHVVDACASVVETLLRSCPNLRILATSREPLRVPGEVAWRVEPLAVPDPARLPIVDQLADYEAIRLFVERAGTAAPGFRLTAENASAVASVVARVDGIPLAIELAAARTSALSVQEIARRLEDRFRLLTGGGRAAPSRHQSLRAALDWTHDALSPAEQALFRRLSVFGGSFTLEAAEQVCAGEPCDEGDVVDLLSSLVDKSLVVSEGLDTGRCRLLATLRQYGGQKLEAAGEADSVRQRHLAWALGLAEEWTPRGAGRAIPDRLARLDADHENLRVALTTALSTGRIEALYRLTAALAPFWRMRGYLEEGRTWVESALSQPASGDGARTRTVLLLDAAELANRLGDFETARARYEDSFAIAQRLGDDHTLTAARHGLALMAEHGGDLARARRLHEENLAARRASGDELGVARSLLGLSEVLTQEAEDERFRDLVTEAVAILRTLDEPATLALALRRWGQCMRPVDPAQARAALEEAVAIQEQLGDPLGLADAVASLANFEAAQANFARGYELLEQVLRIRRQLGDRGSLAYALYQFGHMVQCTEDYAGARRLYQEGTDVARQIGDKHAEAHGLENLALQSMYESDFDAARPLLERAVRIFHERGDRSCEQGALMSLGDLAWGEGRVDAALPLYRASLHQAAAMGRKVVVAFCLERLGSHGALGDFERAARLLGGAQGIRDRLGAKRPLYGVPEWEQDVAIARAGLGDQTFERAWAEGYNMPFDQLVRYAAGTGQSAEPGARSLAEK